MSLHWARWWRHQTNSEVLIIKLTWILYLSTDCGVALYELIGSLSKHDSDGSENVIWKCNFAFLQRRRRQQKPHKCAYLTMENSIFARFARAYFIYWHFEDVLVLSTTWNDLFCRCVDDESIWWQMFNFVFLCLKRWFQFNARTVRTHFLSITTLNN